MKLLMLDTNVVLDILFNETKALNKLQDFTEYQFAISHLIYMEVMAGARLFEKKDCRKFLKRFNILPYNDSAQLVSVKMADKYFTGRENKPMDLMIAAHAKSINIPIITNNAKDFIFKEAEVFSLQEIISRLKL